MIKVKIVITSGVFGLGGTSPLKNMRIPSINKLAGLHGSMHIHPAVHLRSLDFIVFTYTTTNKLKYNSIFTEPWESNLLQLFKLTMKKKSRNHQNIQRGL